MEIKHRNFTIEEVASGYISNEDYGVIGYSGRLNIRPAYQREFVYKDKQREAVIHTIMKGFPLNVMYWAKNEDGTYEVLDGQQRTISFCQYVLGNFSVDVDGVPMYFHNLTDAEQRLILSYPIDVYICEGNGKERLDWFRTINIAGEKLTDQELLNINYTGKWLTDAKRKFSKNNCLAYKIGNKFIKGSPIRQEYLETVLDWISDGNIAEYMSEHQHDENANDLWLYFNNVISWIEVTFNTEKYYRKEMCGLNWGKLYKEYSSKHYDSEVLEEKIHALMENEEVTDKKGIYEYVLSGELESIARKLSKRTFSISDKRTVYEKQGGVCPICGEHYAFEEMEGDHIIPWWRGGKTILDNLQMVCKKCNNGKSGKLVS